MMHDVKILRIQGEQGEDLTVAKKLFYVQASPAQ